MVRIVFGEDSSGSNIQADLEVADLIIIPRNCTSIVGDPVLGTGCGHSHFILT